MKKVSLLMAVSLFASSFAVQPVLAHTLAQPVLQQQQQKQLKFQSDEERAAYELFFTEKDPAKKATLAKDFFQKFPNSDYAPYVKRAILTKLGEDFQTALKTYYQGADAAKLAQLLSTGEEYFTYQPGQLYILTQMALASGYGVLAAFNKDIDKSRSQAEQVTKILESPTAPEGWKPDEYEKFRLEGMGKLTQYLGLYALRQTPPDPEKAVSHLTKAAETKEWATPKDPNTYSLRAEANSLLYDKLSSQYLGLPEEKKTEQEGKALLAQIDPVVDKLIDDYARAVALLSRPEAKSLQDAVKERLAQFYQYRYNKLDGMEDLIKYYQADPTAPPPPKPTATPAPAAQQNSGTKPPTAGRTSGN
jgi:hypothetical protein